ncbi:aldolase/citrate lyase family protein [Salmonella enterica]|nr:aldolase/citrate lyase family protein [Salmonella enterica]
MISASLQQRKTRTRRSMLFVPGANAAMVSNSFIYPADALMFDLEDSVALREKDAARRLVYHALQHPLYRDVETIVRVNALDSEWGVNDLEAVVRGGADVVRLPKTDTAQDVIDIENEILRIENACGREPGSTGLLAAVESPLGITRAVEIAHASERLIGIALGAEDYVRNLRTERSPEGTELLFARCAAEVIAHSGYFNEGFSLQTGTGGASLAVTRFLEDKMRSRNIVANFALGGITATMVDLHEKGLIRKLLDVQSFDRNAAQSLARNPNHIEISANQYANWGSKGASVDRLDVVVLSALEVDTHFNVNVLTGSDGVLRGASGGHCDTAVAAALSIIVAPLVRGRIPTLVDNVTTCVTPGSSVDILVTDHGIAVNPARPELAERLKAAGMKVVSIEWLRERAQLLTGQPRPIEFTDRVIAVVRYRDGSVIDVVHQVKE